MLIDRIDSKKLIEPIKSYGEFPIIITFIPTSSVDVVCVQLGNETYNNFSKSEIASIQAHFQIAVNEYKLKEAVLCQYGVFNAIKNSLDNNANRIELKKEIINNDENDIIKNANLLSNYILDLDIDIVKENIIFIQMGSVREPLKDDKIDQITINAIDLLEAKNFSPSILKGLCFHHFISIEAYKI